MTKEEIWEKLATEVKLRGFSPQTYHTYKCNINGVKDLLTCPRIAQSSCH